MRSKHGSKEKHGVSSFLGAMGVIALLAGIFLSGLEFTEGLVIAITFWIMAGIVEAFFYQKWENNQDRYRKLAASILGGTGLIVIIGTIFDVFRIEFTEALFIAITLWILSGVIGPPNISRYSSKYRQRFMPYDAKPVTDGGSYQSTSQTQQKITTYTVTQPSESEEGPAKGQCSSCGSSVATDAIFCQNCGSKQN